jgi:hypothetical protein
VSERGGERKRDQPWNKMTPEEAERLRALLRDTRPAGYDPSGLQRVGKANRASDLSRTPKAHQGTNTNPHNS